MQIVNRYIAGVLLAVISTVSAWAQTDSVSQDTMPQS